MNRIKILPDSLINKIAAGEVLERPASAVKELVENSIDANSKKINIFIKNGGKKEITVSDDGYGINKDDLEKAVSRHATSKINGLDFYKIKTMGFRGEALSSIVSVSDFTLKSKQQNQSVGYEISFSSGSLKHIKPVSQKNGTYVTVKNLFCSTPVRLKFLKTENYESQLIKRLIQKFAIINFDIEFNLFIDEKKILQIKVPKIDCQSREIPKERVREVLGKEFIENSIKINEKKDDLFVGGFLGIPTFNYSNSNNQFVYVNGRIINDKSLTTIFRVAYRDLMFHDKFPQLVLDIRCPLDWVDVNVHPMKNEVRFKDIVFLKSFLISSIRTTLEKITHKASTLNSRKIIEKIKPKNDFQQNLVLKEKSLNFDDELYEEEIKKNDTETHPLGFAKSQFHENFIISETEKGIIIVDQHAAHERIVYEKLKQDFYGNKIKTQILLIPVVIDVDNLVIESLSEKLAMLEKYGLKIEVFGSKSIIVREIPIIISNCNVKKLIEAIISEKVMEEDFNTIEAEINKICSTIACHGSIRSGRKLQVDEMNELLRKMENTKFSGQCNHGRPTYIELNLNEIEKLFGRK